jgi:hypothetical protein
MSENPEHDTPSVDALFVQTAAACTSSDGRLTLRGLAESTVYFADRPRRQVGHISSHRFISLWDGEETGFAAEPPTAVLSFLDVAGSAPGDVVVALKEPDIDSDSLTYSVDVLEGTLPASAGPCSLFIDALGRPLAPVSAMRPREQAGRSRA